MDRHRESFVPNPLLGSIAGLCPAIAVTSALPEAILLWLGTLVVLFFLWMSIPLAKNLLPERLLTPFSLSLMAISASAYGVLASVLWPLLAANLNIYIPLIAVNSMILHYLRANLRPGKNQLKAPLSIILGYSFSFIPIATLREILGRGSLSLPSLTLAPRILFELKEAPLRIVASPAGGFMILGILAALYRFILHTRRSARP